MRIQNIEEAHALAIIHDEVMLEQYFWFIGPGLRFSE